MFAKKNVSNTIFFVMFIPFSIKKSLSKYVLCHKIGVSHINFSISCFMCSNFGEFSTISSVIHVIFIFNSGILNHGFTNVLYSSIISNVFSSNLINATSIIASFSFDNQVVSRSKATIIL